MRRLQRCRRRGTEGVSLIELVVGSILMSVSLAVVAELMALCVLANSKLFNQFDAQMGANFALDRMKRDIRMSRELCSETTEFGNVKKSLNSRTLILRIPIHYALKRDEPSDPSYNPSAEPDPLTGFLLPGYYTVLYELIPDAENPDEFLLTYSCRRTLAAVDDQLVLRSPVDNQVIAKGIIGPLEVGGGSMPKVFTYIAKSPLQQERLDALLESTLYDQAIVDGVSGIGLDFEMKRGQTSGPSKEKVLAVHSEVFLRLPVNELGPRNLTVYEP